MRRTKKPSSKNLLVSVEPIRSLDNDQLRNANGGACPTSRPVR